MAATLRPIGALVRQAGGRTAIEVDAGLTVSEALRRVGLAPELVAFVVVNETHERKDYVLRDGDVVEVLAVIGGG